MSFRPLRLPLARRQFQTEATNHDDLARTFAAMLIRDSRATSISVPVSHPGRHERWNSKRWFRWICLRHSFATFAGSA